MVNKVRYSKMKIAMLKILFYIILFLSIQPEFSIAFIINEVTVQDTIKQDTVFVKPDSISMKIPQKIVSEDTTFLQYMESPWKMSKSTMNQYFHEDLGDLLNYFLGIYVLDFGSSGQRLSLSRHGADAKQTRLFFDDRPFYDPIYGGIDLNLIPVGFTKTITVERGLSSPFITSNAEMISLKSDNYEEDIPYSQVSYHKAPYGFSDIDIILGRRISRKINILLGGIIKSYDGKNESHRFEQQNFRGKIHYSLSTNWQFNYSWIHNKINRHQPVLLLEDSLFISSNVIEKVSRFDQTLNIKGKIFRSSLQNLSTNLFYSNYHSNLRDKNSDFRLTNPCKYAGFNFQMHNHFLGQKMIIGGDFVHEWTDADITGKHQHTFGSLFIQDDLTWQEKIDLRILGSYHLHNIHGSNLLAGISSNFQLVKMLKFVTSLKQSIRYPTFFELNAKNNYHGNPNLKTEFIQKITTGVEWQLESDFSLQAYFYLKNIQHLIEYNNLDSLAMTFINQSTALRFSGLDLQFKWNLFSKSQLFTVFSAIDNTDLFDQPRFMLISYLQYNDSFFQNDLRTTFRLEGRYIGERKNRILYPDYFVPNFEKLNSVFILNVHAILNFGNLKIFFTLENLFDHVYQLTYGYPMNGRTLHYGLRWEFWD